ncbi:MAG: VOC family protein [Alphaproteobacteria bacterium]|nr:VOC family protein [Alphaproteobacteria bacterium]
MTFDINRLVPELWCSDFQASLAFYTEKLGFEIAQQRGADPHAYLAFQGAQIMVAHWTFDGSFEPWSPDEMERPFGRGVNLQFMVDDVQGVHDRIVSRGVEPFRDLYISTIWRTDRMDARKQFMVLDPDGYLLRFSETISHRPVEPADVERLNAFYGTSG